MSDDVKCPYCNKWQEIDHDDGYGYDEGVLHKQECDSCEKTFAYNTSISYCYSAYQADCLNGGSHKLRTRASIQTDGEPRPICEDCGEIVEEEKCLK